MNTQVIIALIIVVLGIGGFWYVKTADNNDAMEADKMMQDDDAMMSDEKDVMEDDSMMKDEDTAMMDDQEPIVLDQLTEIGGLYEEYSPEKLAVAEDLKVVLFFRAKWCPTCAALHEDITHSLDAIPVDVLILDVDYDTYTVLKQKYGVTYQHTFVQVDANGDVVKKWSGGETLEKLIAEIQ